MTCRATFKMTGFDEYLEQIARAGENIDAAADRAIMAGGDVLLAGMEERVPRDTGNLAAHLERSDPEVDGNIHFLTVGIREGTDANTARYGNVQEYGSAHTPKHPYIRPAFDEDGNKARAAEKASLKADGAI